VYKTLYAALPVSSYHVTLCDLFTRWKYKNAAEYNNEICSHLEKFERIKYYYENQQESVVFYVADVISWGSVFALHLKPKTADDATRLRRLEERTKEILGGLYSQQHTSHLTLVYKIDHQTNHVDEIRLRVKELMQNVDVVCKRPQLCKFKDMTEFVPL